MDNFLRITTCFIFLWCLLGCTVGPDYEKPKLFEDKEIQKALDLKPIEKAEKKSYLIFEDSVLNQLLAKAVENSPTVRAAITKVKQARLSVKIAEVQGLPTLDAMGQYQYVKESRTLGYVFDEDIYQVGFDAAWEIDIFGGTRRKTEAAMAQAYAVIANLDNVYVSLTAEVAQSYISLRQAQTDNTLLKKILEAEAESLLQTQHLYASGVASQDVLNKAQMQVDSTRSDIAANETSIEQSKNQLALLTGQLPSSLDKLLKPQKENLIDKPFAFPLNKLYEMSASVVENRPDVTSAAYALMAQNAEVGAAIADLYPKVSLSGMLGFESLHLDKLLNHKSYSYSLTPGFSIPLFYFGQLKNQVEIQKEKYNESFANYENTFLTAAEEIKNALVALQGAERQYDAALSAFQQMQNVYILTQKKYDAGLMNVIDFASVRVEYLQSKQSLVSANSALYSGIVRFFKSIGAVS